MMRWLDRSGFGLLSPSLMLLLGAFLAPLAFLVPVSFRPYVPGRGIGEGFTGEHYVRFFTDLYYLEIFGRTILLGAILLYSWIEYRRSPAVALLTVVVAGAGIYFVWVPEHSTQLAELVGIGRGVDLILYIWVCISLIVLLNLHLKLRTQTELITTLARKIAIADAQPPKT